MADVAEEADVVAAVLVAEEVLEAEARKSSSSHTDTVEASSQRARKMSSSPRTWYLATLFTAKRKLR